MEISTKTLHFIEEHREDDTRTLALQSKKCRTAGGGPQDTFMVSGFCIMVSPSFVYGAMFFRSNCFV